METRGVELEPMHSDMGNMGEGMMDKPARPTKYKGLQKDKFSDVSCPAPQRKQIKQKSKKEKTADKNDEPRRGYDLYVK